jgi:signal transduction histidine kinase
VTLVRHEPAAQTLIARVAQSAAHGQRFAVFETELGGERYQVVARLMYRTSRRAELQRVFGFLVNLNWVRTSYFSELTDTVRRIAAAGPGVNTAIYDEHGALVAGIPGIGNERPAAVRHIRPLFFDPSLVGVDPAEDLPLQNWTVAVSAAVDPARTFALRGADRSIAATTAAIAVLGIGLLLTARALRASADLAKLRCDFVASVTHELKTPLSTIRIVGETLSRGRLHTGGEIREYAQLVDQEAKRLTRLVDNLLTYSRVTDVSEVYSFEPLDLADFIEDVLRGFQPQFAHRSFDVRVDIPPDLPLVRGDRTALSLVFDNLVDNAMRYSADDRRIAITAHEDGRRVVVDVEDHGIGIPPDELATVVRRFVRGRQSGVHGSGLGLAIASRVVTDHGGELTLESTLAAGTKVRVSLPREQGME